MLNASTSTTPAARLRATSAAEAAKIREYAEAWVAFEPAATRMAKSKRWRSLHARFLATAKHVWGTPARQCIDAWVEWQLLRAVSATLDMVRENQGSLTPMADAVHYVTLACAELASNRRGALKTFETWRSGLIVHAVAADGDPEEAMLQGARPVSEWVHTQLAARVLQRGSLRDTRHLALRALGALTKLDGGQRAALLLGVEHVEVLRTLTDEGERTTLLAPATIEERRQAFRRAFGELREMARPLDEVMQRRSRLIRALVPDIAHPAAEWRDAHFVQWLLDENILRVCERLCGGQKRDAFGLDTPFDVPLFLSSPLCWRLWLNDRWEAARLPPATLDPPRTILRELAESPGRFFRFPNPTPEFSAMRRVLRPVADVLEGPALPIERAALLETLSSDAATAGARLQMLADYCARRWRAGVPPNTAARVVERLTEFLQDDILPQAPEILRGCAVEVGQALRSRFDEEFENLLAAEERAQERLEADLRQHAESWRALAVARDTPPSAGSAKEAESADAGAAPVVVRYIFNLGEPLPREQRIATTWAGLDDALEELCVREGIGVSIPFSSIAHALQHYVLHTPPEKKHVWPERETYGPLELHKIKRGGMRLLVRESDAGLWLHLLQRRDWFLGGR